MIFSAIRRIFKKIGHTATSDRDGYWRYQRTLGDYYLAELQKYPLSGKTVLDIGCGEGGVLASFEAAGFNCYGLEVSAQRIEYARQRLGTRIQWLHAGIEQLEMCETFDLILMLDVIEHLAEKERALQVLRRALKLNGLALITFPPYRSAFGGHQQSLRSFLKYIPYWHILPRNVFRQLLRWFEKEHLDARLEIYDRGLTIARFERLIRTAGLRVIQREVYWIRPRQSLRFGIPIRPNRLPFGREFFTTGVNYILTPAAQAS